ncbi:WXG100 family type VII secretion target [Streptomyces xiamenensis]|uniref:WXG100 family type VII secretion target n=1 Tax=Streptomyces xiamenensis TaxID=408015 RepID=UPI003D70FA27
MEDSGGYQGTYQGHGREDYAADQLQGMSHRDLAGLLAGARPDALIQRGEALEAVAEAVEWVGEQIWSRAGELEWQGRTADEFREWIRHFHHASVDLKTYASFMASAITNAGVALRQAQSEMPPAPPQEMPATALDVAYDTGDGDRPMTMTEAESSRQEAIAVISRLGSVYKTSAGTIQYVNEREPRFRAPDGVIGPTPSVDLPASTPDSEIHQPGDPQPRFAPAQQPAGAPTFRSSEVSPPTPHASGQGAASDQGGVGTSLDSVGVVPNGGVPPVAPPGSPPSLVVERPVGGGPVQQPVVGPVPGWPSPAQPGQGPGRGGGGQVPPVRGPGLRPGEAPVVRPLGSPSGPGSQPPVGRPAPGVPGGQQPPVGRPPTGGGGPGGGNPWGRANNYGLLGGKPVPNAKPTVASRIPPGGVIQPGMNAANSRLTPSRNDQPNAPRPTYGKATVDGRPATGRGERGRSLPKPTGVIGLPGQGRKNGKKKKKKNESKDDRQQP